MKHRILLLLLIALSGTMALYAQVTVSGSHASSNGTYTKLSLAFTAINTYSQTGNNIVITITSAPTAESGSATLNAGTWTTLKIYPTTSGLSISGNFSAPLIDLNGADNATIDGRVNATGLTNDMTISNTNTSAGGTTSTIRFINGATNNTIQYCIIKGSTTNSESGILCFSTSTGTSGNSSNVVDHNEITNAAGSRPVSAITSDGSASYYNSSNTISNNNIHDVLNANPNHAFVIKLGIGGDGGQSYNDAWTISGNSFYDTQDYTITTGNNMRILYIYADGGNAFNILNNYFGGSAPLCGGTWNKTTGNNTFQLMEFRVGTSTASEIQGNTIKNINFTNTGSNKWWGINMQRGKINIGTTAGNCYGASDGTGSITFTGTGNGSEFYAFHFQSSDVNAQNNIIGSITVANT
ncbi:MAG: hypothetical protein WCK03_04940, partial [Candidatus Taylorbacteria bacterium]